uniref:Uncharacterized protein n=1 Tax=viral metagenome TaxID=1070528 RepID=A0A6H1Z9U7_9ZZZZ
MKKTVNPVRNKEREQMFDEIAKKMFGRKFSAALDDMACVRCGASIVGFRDVNSAREYNVSGLCQKCQDQMFNPPDEYVYTNDDVNWSDST